MLSAKGELRPSGESPIAKPRNISGQPGGAAQARPDIGEVGAGDDNQVFVICGLAYMYGFP